MASFTSIDLTKFDLTPSGRAARLAVDATYVTVGLSLLTFQRIQVRRREFERSLRR
ncbi:MAG: hypothetical protein KUG57_04165 [Ilumatobacteraceae bacterium]|nr:hypothetical protein [Ilumatobacteraceae bacterium]